MDALAALTSFIPEKGQQVVRYYGYYGNKARGQRRKRQQSSTDITPLRNTLPEAEQDDFRRHSRRAILLLADVPDSGHNRTVKPIDFHPRALELIRRQTASIRRQIGEVLRDLQKGMTPGMPLSRPMSVVAPGVRELRVRDETTTVRVFYSTGRIDSIVVFHAFQKKSQKTPTREIDLARRRLREVLDAKIEF